MFDRAIPVSLPARPLNATGKPRNAWRHTIGAFAFCRRRTCLLSNWCLRVSWMLRPGDWIVAVALLRKPANEPPAGLRRRQVLDHDEVGALAAGAAEDNDDAVGVRDELEDADHAGDGPAGVPAPAPPRYR